MYVKRVPEHQMDHWICQCAIGVSDDAEAERLHFSSWQRNKEQGLFFCQGTDQFLLAELGHTSVVFFISLLKVY